MATQKRSLLNETTFYDSKNYHPTHSIVGLFIPDDIAVTDRDTDNEDLLGGAAATQRGDIWPAMTPVYYDLASTTWRIWRGAQSIEGLLIGATGHSTDAYQNGVSGKLQMHPTLDVQAVIMINGDVDARDVFLPPDPTTATTTQVNLDLAMAADLRALGINVSHLAGVH